MWAEFFVCYILYENCIERRLSDHILSDTYYSDLRQGLFCSTLQKIPASWTARYELFDSSQSDGADSIQHYKQTLHYTMKMEKIITSNHGLADALLAIASSDYIYFIYFSSISEWDEWAERNV